MKLNAVEQKQLSNAAKEIASQVQDLCANLLVDNLKNMRVTSNVQGSLSIAIKDLRQLLSAFDPEAHTVIPSHLAYRLFIETGICLKGFKPNKTALRTVYNLSLDKINELLPGSYKQTTGWRVK